MNMEIFTETEYDRDIYENNLHTNAGADYRSWKESLADRTINKLLRGGVYAEIGVGHGRWASYAVGWAYRSFLIDIDQSCLDYCKRRFGPRPFIRYLTDIKKIDFGSVDLVWSFDTFQYMDTATINDYLDHVARILKKGGHAVLHYSENLMEAGKARGLQADCGTRWCAEYGLSSGYITIFRNGEAPAGIVPPGPRIKYLLPEPPPVRKESNHQAGQNSNKADPLPESGSQDNSQESSQHAEQSPTE